MPPLPLYHDEEKASRLNQQFEFEQGQEEATRFDKEEEIKQDDMIPVKSTRWITRLVALVLIVYFAIYPLAELAAANVRNGSSRSLLRGWRDCKNGHGVGQVGMGKGVDGKEHGLVPLEAHIMSKCPDAQACLQKLVLPTMQRVSEKVNFTLSFIGTPTDNDGVECMHGPEECMGNIIELCAAKLYPSPKSYLGFTMCLTRDYPSIPQKSLIEDCALEHGLDFEKLEACTEEENGGTGIALLRDSVRRSTDAGVTMSCTVRLNEQVYCIRDGGEWKECPHGAGVNDLVIAIEKQYRTLA